MERFGMPFEFPPSAQTFVSLGSAITSLFALYFSRKSAGTARTSANERRSTDIEARRANYLRRLAVYDLRSSTNLKECESMRRVLVGVPDPQSKVVFSNLHSNFVHELRKNIDDLKQAFDEIAELTSTSPNPSKVWQTLVEYETRLDQMKVDNLNLDNRVSKYVESINNFVIAANNSARNRSRS